MYEAMNEGHLMENFRYFGPNFKQTKVLRLKIFDSSNRNSFFKAHGNHSRRRILVIDGWNDDIFMQFEHFFTSF